MTTVGEWNTEYDGIVSCTEDSDCIDNGTVDTCGEPLLGGSPAANTTKMCIDKSFCDLEVYVGEDVAVISCQAKNMVFNIVFSLCLIIFGVFTEI